MCLEVAAENKGYAGVKGTTFNIVEGFNTQDKMSYWHLLLFIELDGLYCKRKRVKWKTKIKSQ